MNVLFEIICESSLERINVICADITALSNHEKELEVLFGLGSCFQIVSTRMETNLRVFQLKVVNDATSVS